MRIFLALLLCAIYSANPGAAAAQASRKGDANLLPRYGAAPKSRALLKADAEFLAACDRDFPSRQAASSSYAQRGWAFFRVGDASTAIKRFNQAWLLDTTNAAAYWGFGAVAGLRKQYDASLRDFRISLRLNPANTRVLLDIAQTHIVRYLNDNQTSDLDAAISNSLLFLADSHDAQANTEAYLKLATASFYKQEYTGSWTYLDSATALNPDATRGWDLLPELIRVSPRED